MKRCAARPVNEMQQNKRLISANEHALSWHIGSRCRNPGVAQQCQS
jgi:hypothetical protein